VQKVQTLQHKKAPKNFFLFVLFLTNLCGGAGDPKTSKYDFISALYFSAWYFSALHCTVLSKQSHPEIFKPFRNV
jgi:hypothetical protein